MTASSSTSDRDANRITDPETIARMVDFWGKHPSIDSRMPLRFETTGYRLTEFDGECNCCQRNIARADVRGTVVRPIPRVAVIEAVGVCHDCRFITGFYLRVRDDLTLEWINAQGRWVRASPKPTVWAHIKRWLRRLGLMPYRKD